MFSRAIRRFGTTMSQQPEFVYKIFPSAAEDSRYVFLVRVFG